MKSGYVKIHVALIFVVVVVVLLLFILNLRCSSLAHNTTYKTPVVLLSLCIFIPHTLSANALSKGLPEFDRRGRRKKRKKKKKKRNRPVSPMT